MELLLGLLLAVSSWAAPQPVYSEGLIVNYGGESVIRANADYHGYSLDGYAGGASAISPAMLGRIMWVRTAHSGWLGPFIIVDAVARVHAYESIYLRHEIAEVSRATAAQLGFEYGAPGYVWFGQCPPPADSLFPVPLPYAPPLAWEAADSPGRSFWPYPEQQLPANCF